MPGYMLCAALILPVLCIAAPPRGENLVRNPGFEAITDGRADHWRPAGRGYALSRDITRSGGVAIVCESTSPDESYGAMQEITFDPPVHHPFKVSGWSRAEDVEGADYALWMDCWYEDGTNLWAQKMSFTPGTHDWEQIEYVFHPEKPVTRIQYFILFRRCVGRAWFDDVSLSLAPFEVEREHLAAGVYGGNSIDYSVRLSLPAEWSLSVLRGERVLREVTGQGAGASLGWDGRDAEGGLQPGGEYTVRLVATDDLQGEQLRHEAHTTTPSGPGRGYVAWTESSMNRVLENSLPPAEPSLAARIALARNEYESFQVVLRAAPNRNLADCTVEVGDLRGPQGAVISGENLKWQQVGFVDIAKLFNHPRLPEEAVPGWWPDPLLPVSRFSVPGGTTQALWFTLYAPPGTPAGEYAGSVAIRPADGPETHVALDVTVYDFDLPTEPSIKTAFALMDGFLERIYGRPLTPELRRAYGDFLLHHRLNPDDISRTDPPDIEDIAHYYDRGLNAFNVINMVQPRGERTWVCWSPLEVYTPEFKASLVERLDPYVEELRRRGLADKAYVYTFDERREEFFAVMREYFGLVKERWDIPTLTTAKVPQDPAVMRDLNVDWNCPLTSVYNFEQAEACREEGLEVWAYICLVPRYPYANWLAEEPLIEGRVIWWQAFHQKMDGFLYWGVNIWARAHNDHIIDPEADGPRLRWSITTGGRHDSLHGDGVLLYPGPDGPFGSIRLANIRDGIEDYEYLHLLSALEGDLETAREACLPVTTSLVEFTRDPDVVYARREAIARRIEALQRRAE